MKLLSFFFISLLSSELIAGQDIDSLESILTRTSDHHEQILILEEAYDFYEGVDSEKALFIAEKSVNIAQEFSQKDLPKSYNLLGYHYINNGESDSAMFYFQEALDYCLLRNDSVYLAKTYNNLGVLEFMTENYEGGLAFFNQAANIELAIGAVDDATLSFVNLSAIYIQLNDNETAEKYLTKALDLALTSEDRALLAHTYINLGSLEKLKGNMAQAKKNYFNAIDIYKDEGDWLGVSDTYGNLAVLYEDIGDPDMALKYNNFSLKYLLKLDNPIAADMRNAYKTAAEALELKGEYEESIEYYKLYIAWNDSVLVQENRNFMLETQEKYNTERTERENELLATQNKVADLELQKGKEELTNSRIIIWSSIIGLVLLLLSVFTLYNRNRIKQQANNKLTQAYAIINEKNEDITASILYARKIQEALLPTKANKKLFKDSFVILMPRDIVSGDFYWYSKVGDELIFAAVDCTGHGVPGAFMSMIGNTFLHQIVNEKKITTPAIILNELREKVINALIREGGGNMRKDGMDMSICALNQKTNKVQFAGANNPAYICQGGEMKILKGDKMPVGYMHGESIPFENQEMQLSEGDAIYLFSDGYADQFGGDPKIKLSGKKMKYKPFRNLLHKNHTLAMAEQKELLLDIFHKWKGDFEQVDDVLVIGVRV
ncbi:MAG: tetratricopeptide repeat protein [Crocinitomicaceae bacterium]|nr:tetratricopeptide repeat protein [Crocinitomicaceae bacterium]